MQLFPSSFWGDFSLAAPCRRPPQTPPVTVIIVSHDAAFLGATVTDVLLLAHGAKQLEHHEGSFSQFRVAKPEARQPQTAHSTFLLPRRSALSSLCLEAELLNQACRHRNEDATL